MNGRFLRWAVAVLLMPLMTACSIGPVRQPPPDRAAPPPNPATTAPASSPTVSDVEVREVRVAVGQRYEAPYVEFVTAERGYAQFSCGPPVDRSCPALLYATTDGGRTWRRLRHPHPVSENPQLHVAPGGLAISVGPGDWYTSTDGGVTFAHTGGERAPAVWQAAQGRFQIDEATGRAVRWQGQRMTPLPAQPPVPDLHGIVETRGLLVAGGVDGGKPYAAISPDGGRSWQRTAVPASGGEVGMLRPVAGPDGEARLIGWPPDRTRFPTLWRYLGRWTPVPAEGHPARALSVVPLTTGRFAVSGPDGVGVVADGRYDRLDWPLGPEHYLTLLDDGTVLGRASDEVLLASGPVGSRGWVRVVLGPA
ncbi:beta propeller repeat protein [Micromonospora rubida]|uniref:hypothetical protein n=1 Tax=Micromonospora rubida TaxID=2697657 RepID=UPI001378464B|nr:hypothetical protein [Micromonospora rubida]NBE82458.1 hypothetical protein [Micromonospora rubida]